ncbi:MAG: toxin-antitoxin system YwqK family antitoxin [Flammeovirgaceae bacterium]
MFRSLFKRLFLLTTFYNSAIKRTAVFTGLHKKQRWIKALFMLLLFGQCSSPQRPYINLEKVQMRTHQGIAYCNQQPCTGRLYRLYPLSADTLEYIEYLNGRVDGVSKKFYRGGKLQELRYFTNGKKEGIYQAWHISGQLKLAYHFMNDEYEGTCRDWNEHGRLIQLKNYRQGHEHGLQQIWDAAGYLWANYEVRNGRQYGITGKKGCATLATKSLSIDDPKDRSTKLQQTPSHFEVQH